MTEPKRKHFHQRTIALVYDFDGTLCPRPMQEYGVLPKISVTPDEFWKEVKDETRKHEAEEILTYMRLMIEKADRAKEKVDRDDFKELGQSITYFPGVGSWFERINSYVREISRGTRISVRHYVVSAGLREIIEGSSIYREFHNVFASTYHYDHYGHAKWPGRVVTDTSKTQYLFRINKGEEDLSKSINTHMPLWKRPIPFSNIIYFGDGETDVPSSREFLLPGRL